APRWPRPGPRACGLRRRSPRRPRPRPRAPRRRRRAPTPSGPVRPDRSRSSRRSAASSPRRRLRARPRPPRPPRPAIAPSAPPSAAIAWRSTSATARPPTPTRPRSRRARGRGPTSRPRRSGSAGRRASSSPSAGTSSWAGAGSSMRAELGQVLTPPSVADLVLSLALDGLGRDARVLDPACGDGVFLARAAARGVRAAGVEIQPALAAAAAAHGDVRCGDFFALAPAEHDAVVGNPPYVRQERIGAGKRRLGKLTGAPARADLALAFVLRALQFVRPGGRVAFVLSAAVLDADYGAALAGAGRGTHVVARPRGRWFPHAAGHPGVLGIRPGGGGAAARPPPPRPRARAPP